MKIVELILFLIAYTLGIATLIVQVICYLKKMEYLVTIFFIGSFLLLIITVSLDEVNFMLTGKMNNVIGEIMILSMLFLALTTPLNIHKERAVKYASKVNIVLVIISVILFVLLLAGYAFGFEETISIIIKYFMFASVGYSMITILVTKPGMLVRPRDRTERITSLIFFSVFPLFIVLDIFYDRLVFIHPFVPEGPYILMIFFIYLASMKLLDDIKRLTLLTKENTVNQHVIARFGITPRETEVLLLIIKGKSYVEISKELFISLPTVKTHISRAYKKMNINNKIELINLINATQDQPVPSLQK